ncbi:uncharacterized protein C6orf141 homolog isoform X1 [Tamandua tetradactyla]|uniref:uncharacterized protein C6orf141 homolog isoform X1 n=1 Tax=Tamandua tetradactyla TaxID=48850 RepID=UPI004053E7DC
MPRHQQKIMDDARKIKDMAQSKEQTNRSNEIQELRQLMLNIRTEMENFFKNQINKLREDMKKTWAEQKEEIENLKKQITELMGVKDKEEKMEKTMDTYNGRSKETEATISELEDGTSEFQKETETIGKRMGKLEQGIRELNDNMKRTNIRVVGVPEGEEKGKGGEKLMEEIITENFPTLMKDLNLQIQEVQRTPKRIDPNRRSPRHLLVRMSEVKEKERILKAAREKQSVTYKGNPIRLCVDFSAETMEARRQWDDIFKLLKEKNFQPRLLYPAKLSFKNEGEIKTFIEKKSLREFVTKRPALQEILKGALESDTKRQKREVWSKV